MILPKETQSLWRHIDLGILGCIIKSIFHRSREEIPPIWDSTEVLGPFLDSPYKKGKDILSWVQQSTMNMIKRLEHLVYKKTERAGLLSLNKSQGRSPSSLYVNTCLGCRWSTKTDRSRPLSVIRSDGRKGNGQNIKHRKYHLSIRKSILLGSWLYARWGYPEMQWSFHPWRCSKLNWSSPK